MWIGGLECRLSIKERQGEWGREVQSGRQPESESGLPRCGSLGYPLASGHINDQSHGTAVNTGKVASFCPLKTAYIYPYNIIEQFYPIGRIQSKQTKCTDCLNSLKSLGFGLSTFYFIFILMYKFCIKSHLFFSPHAIVKSAATLASSIHHTDLWESIDSAFSLVPLLLLSWALSLSGPSREEGGGVAFPQRLNRMRSHTHI